jgi:hypothetical protein
MPDYLIRTISNLLALIDWVGNSHAASVVATTSVSSGGKDHSYAKTVMEFAHKGYCRCKDFIGSDFTELPLFRYGMERTL